MTTREEKTETPNVRRARLWPYAFLFAAILWGFLLVLGALTAYAGLRLGAFGSILLLLIASFSTSRVIVSRLKRGLTNLEVARFAAMCFIAHWAQDVLFPFLYKANISGDYSFDPLVKAVTVGTAFLFTWLALAFANAIWGTKYESSPPVA